MNIVFHRYNSICEPDYIEAFRLLGIDVIEDMAGVDEYSTGINALVEHLGRLVLTNHPMFVFSINFFPYISIVCEKLNIKYVCVSVDCPVMEIYNTAIRNSCNRVFLFDYRQYLSIKDENPDNIFHLPLGAVPDRIDRTLGCFDDITPEYKYDISFVGSLYNEKDPYADLELNEYEKGWFDGMITVQSLFDGLSLLEKTISPEHIQALKDADPGFYPSDMGVRNLDEIVAVDNYLSYHLAYRDRIRLLAVLSGNLTEYDIHLFTKSDTSFLKELVSSDNLIIHGGVSSLEEMPRVFRTSRININHTMRSIRTGLSQRIWDVLASGGFLLTNAQAEIPQYLEPGIHLETYESMDEMLDKANYYLIHEDERQKIALSGYRAVKNGHSVLNRVVEMIKLIS